MKKIVHLLMVLAFLASQQAIAEVAVIVNLKNSSNISANDISRIFLGKNKSFASGETVKAINLISGTQTRAEFERKALNKSNQQVKAYWSKLIFSGKAKPLMEVGTAQEALTYVANNAGAIAYIDASLVNDTVKVVTRFK